MNFKTIFIILAIVLFQYNFSFAQIKKAQNWYFGKEAGLSFKTSPPTVLTDGKTSCNSMRLTMSDDNGNLLFYSECEGLTYNRNHQLMMGCTIPIPIQFQYNLGLLACIPQPNNNYVYYIFGVEGGNYYINHRIVCYIIDMRLDNGLGAIVNPGGTIFSFNYFFSPHITAMGHANGTEYWLIVPGGIDSNSIYSFKINSSGLDTIPIISTKLKNSSLTPKFSSKGNKFAIYGDGLIVYHFDRSTGLISSPTIIHNIKSGNEIAFSRNEEILYFGLPDSCLYQYNFSTQQSVKIQNNIELGLQMAIDGKIYFTQFPGGGSDAFTWGHQYLGAINKPDLIYPACEIQDSVIYLQGKIGFGYLPAFVESFMQPPDMENFGTCEGDNTHFWFTDTTLIQSISWSFGDSHTSTAVEPCHKFATQGTYSVLCTILTKQGETLHYNKDVKIFPPTKKLVIKHE